MGCLVCRCTLDKACFCGVEVGSGLVVRGTLDLLFRVLAAKDYNTFIYFEITGSAIAVRLALIGVAPPFFFNLELC